MVTLLLFDVGGQDQLSLPASDASAPCLEYLLSENILHKLYEWGIRTGRYAFVNIIHYNSYTDSNYFAGMQMPLG